MSRIFPFLSVCLTCLVLVAAPPTRAWAVPEGYRKQSLPLSGSPVGLAYGDNGTLYALESPVGNTATLKTFFADGSTGTDVTVTGLDENFFVGGMTFDPVGQQLLISDNAAVGRIYAVDLAGNQTTLASGIEAIADLAVRSTGEIFATTAPFGRSGELVQVERSTGVTSIVLNNLGFGAGVILDEGDLLVQDSNSTSFLGRLQKIDITETPGGLQFGMPETLIDGTSAAYGLTIDSEGDFFITGLGGLFQLTGDPLTDGLFDSNGIPGQFATAIAFDAGQASFEPFAGFAGGRLAFTASSFAPADQFVSLIRPRELPNANYNDDDFVDQLDLNTWKTGYGSSVDLPSSGDGDDDGTVAGGDFLLWQRQFAPGAVGNASVPEPTAALLFAASFCTLLGVPARRPKL